MRYPVYIYKDFTTLFNFFFRSFFSALLLVFVSRPLAIVNNPRPP